MTKIIVTGSEGYIGYPMVERLLWLGYDVVGIDNCYFDDEPIGDNRHDGRYTLVRKDVRDISPKDIEGADGIIHLAGLSNDPMGALVADVTDDINHLASLRLAKLAVGAKVRSFIFASSCSVYGRSHDGWVDESSEVNPLTAYAKSKVDTENAVAKLASKTFFPVFFRNSTVYGYSPNMRIDLVANNFAAYGYATGKIVILSDGTPFRPLIHVRDFCDGFCLALEEAESLGGEVINLGSQSQNYTVKEIATEVQKALPGCQVEIRGKGDSDERSYRVKFDRLSARIPRFKSRWDVEKATRETVAMFDKYGFAQADVTSPRYIRLKKLQRLMDDKRIDPRTMRYI